MSSVCDYNIDLTFAYDVTECYGYRDFSLYFEQSVLSSGASALFLLACVYRIYALIKSPVKAPTWCANVVMQLATVVCFGVLQVALLALWSTNNASKTMASIPATALALVTALTMLLVCIFEQSRAVRPSTVLLSFLILSSMFDIAIVRTLWLRVQPKSIAYIYIFTMLCKGLLIGLHSLSKRDRLCKPYNEWPPEALASIISRTLFLWLNSVLVKGSRSVFGISDLFVTDRNLSADYLQRKISTAWNATTMRDDAALMKVTMWCFRGSFMKIIPPRLFMIGFRFSQPLLMRRAVNLIADANGHDIRETGLLLTGATAIVYLGLAFSNAHYKHHIFRSMTMVRGALVTLIYDSTLLLEATAAADSAAVTLMSTDVDRIVLGLEDIDSLFAAPIEVAVAVFLLYRELGLACLMPVIIALLCTLGAVLVGKLTINAQKNWVDAVQERVATTATALDSIKSLKLTGAINTVSMLLQNLRIIELDHSKQFRIATTARNAISNFSMIMTPSLTFLTYVLISRAGSGPSLTPATAFASWSFISLLSTSIQSFTWSVPSFIASIGCYKRIQTYILTRLDEPSTPTPSDAAQSQPSEKSAAALGLVQDNISVDSAHVVRLENATFSYGDDLTPVLDGISMEVQPQTVTLIVGPIGCGKSTLLKGIIGELKPRQGTVTMRSPSVAYCSHEPWLPNKSVLDIITGGGPVDQKWLQRVISTCCLDHDLTKLENGIHTSVGSKGSILSGGQKQRVALARAIYSRRQLLLLDDISSGFDKKTELQVFGQLFGRNGLCRSLRMTAIIVTTAAQCHRFADTVITLREDGNLSDATTIGNSSSDSSDETSEDIELIGPMGVSVMSETELDGVLSDACAVPEADEARQNGDWKAYAYYFKSFNPIATTFFFVALAGVAFGIKFPTVWLDWWSKEGTQSDVGRVNYYISIMVCYGIIGMLGLLVGVGVLFVVIVPQAGAVIHRNLLDSALRAPYSFSTSTDSGTTLNRFSQDISLIDVQLPSALLQFVDGIFLCLIEGVLIVSSNKYLAATVPIALGVLYLIQKYYLRTSRQMRLLDIEAKAPLYTHFLETLDGVSTIRAFGWQKEYQVAASAFLDTSQRPYYLMYCIQRWLNLVLDLVVAGFAILAVALATQLAGSSPGSLGIALTNLLTFSTSLAYLIQAWTVLETSIGSITRVMDFTTTTPVEDNASSSQGIATSKAQRGNVTISNITASYSPDSPPVIHNVSLSIHQGEKIAVIGRTGSGKSSLLLTLARMLNITSGDITINGIALSTVNPESLRESLICIPQDPFILSKSTIRQNADPTGTISDAVILDCLEKVGLAHLLKDDAVTLDTPIGDWKLTPGLMKLFGLVKALMEKERSDMRCGVLLLDEMTSDVDDAIEAKMVKLVNAEFADFTVIAVAHRAASILDFDRAVVMDSGRVIEEGLVKALLANPESHFSNLLMHASTSP